MMCEDGSNTVRYSETLDSFCKYYTSPEDLEVNIYLRGNLKSCINMSVCNTSSKHIAAHISSLYFPAFTTEVINYSKEKL